MARTVGFLALLLVSICVSAGLALAQAPAAQGYQLLTDPSFRGRWF
jgi:hypothetical protein